MPQTKRSVPVPSLCVNVLNFLDSFGSLYNGVHYAQKGGQRNGHRKGALILFLRDLLSDRQDELRIPVFPNLRQCAMKV